MRKITKQAIEAFMSNTPFKLSNTRVEVDKGSIRLYLHHNLIAQKVDGKIYISNAGWATTTTKDRLNGLLDRLGIRRIYQKDFLWYWKDGEKFPWNCFVEVERDVS